MTHSDRLITLDAASTLLSLDVKTLRRYIAQGRLTGYRIGQRALRVVETEVRMLARPIPAATA